MSNKASKSPEQVDAPVEAVTTVQADPVISLTEFCIRLSETEKRVELIGGFEADERRNGRKNDTAAAFAARFSEFVSRPA